MSELKETTKTIQTTTQMEKQITKLNNNKSKQNTNKEGSGNNYWRFYVEPNIYRTTTFPYPIEQQQEEETLFYNADKYFHLPNRRQNKQQRENENGKCFYRCFSYLYVIRKMFGLCNFLKICFPVCFTLLTEMLWPSLNLIFCKIILCFSSHILYKSFCNSRLIKSSNCLCR